MANRILWGTHTTIPWREWNLFNTRIGRKVATLHTNGKLTWDAGGTKSDWDNTYIPYGIIGRDLRTPIYDGWYTIFKPIGEDFLHDEENLGTLHTVGFRATLGIKERIGAMGGTHFNTRCTFEIEPNEIDWNKVTGQYYDGVNEWDSYYPPYWLDYASLSKIGESTTAVYIADLSLEYQAYMNAQTASGELAFNQFTAEHVNIGHFFRNGFNVQPSTWFGIAYGDAEWFSVLPNAVRVLYLNGAVNSISRRQMKTTGGISIQLLGRGFRIPEADLECYTYSAVGTWDHHVEHIYFIGREGQGTYTLNWNLGGPGREFDQTNDLITIFSMPAMLKGTYRIRIGQEDDQHGNNNTYFSYAGSWRSKDDGRAYPGDEFIFFVTDDPIPPKPPVPYFKWGWKYGDLKIWERYAPIDVRGSENFWEGRVGSVSGQVAEISHGWGEEPEAWHSRAFYGVVENYSLKGPKFHAKLKDLSSLYFNGQLPRYIITSEEFPNAPDGSLSRAFPEILGLHNLTTGTNPGAVEALCVDTTIHRYAMAGGPLHSTPAIYSDGTVVNPADYAIVVEPDGRQYVDFDNDQGDNKITFNCTGYFFGIWNSVNGYIQNPAYIIAFLWAMLMEIPVDFIDWDMVNDLADLFEDAGWEESGRVALTALEGKEEVLRKILYSFGVNFWQSRGGYFRIGRKDISNLDPAKLLFAQLDIFDHPDRQFNLDELINSVKARWNYYPAPEKWGNALDRVDQSSIDWFGSWYMVEEPWDLHWNSNEDFVNQRILEELVKLAYGNQKAEVIVPMDYIDELDIFDNVRVQDPFAPSADGSGESGRYYYITGIDYGWESQSLRLELVDLHWLLQQYFIFGDENLMPDLWEDAGLYRYYGYLCDENTWEFSDGFPGKILIDENLLDQE